MVREDEQVDAGCSSAGAEDGDPLRVSTEVPNILVEPTQGLNLVQQSIVTLSRLISSAEEAWVFVKTKVDVRKRQGGIFKRGQGRDNITKTIKLEEERMQRQEENKERRVQYF